MSSIKNICVMTKNELYSYFVSPTVYIFTIIFLILMGYFTFMMGEFFEVGEANLQQFFLWQPWLYLLLVPAIGMGMWSEERKTGTIELLFTMPVTMSECIISKFLAAWIVLGVAISLTFPIIATVFYLGNPDIGPIICGYIGSFLMSGSYLAVAAFTSALSKSQVVSFIISVVICLLLVLAGFPPVTSIFAEYSNVIDFVASFSFITHFNNLQRGVLDFRDVVFYLSVTVFFLFMTGLNLKNHNAG